MIQNFQKKKTKNVKNITPGNLTCFCNSSLREWSQPLPGLASKELLVPTTGWAGAPSAHAILDVRFTSDRFIDLKVVVLVETLNGYSYTTSKHQIR